MTCFLQAVVCPVADPKCFDSNSDPLDPEVDTESNFAGFGAQTKLKFLRKS